MSGLGSLLVPQPTADTADFHLFVANVKADVATLLYIPFAQSPALTVDALRLDSFASPVGTLELHARRWLDQYAEFADGAPFAGAIVKSSPDDFILHAGFANPLIGNHHTVGRWTRSAGRDCALQFIRKLEPLTRREIDERLRFAASCALPVNLFAPPPEPYTRYAADAQRTSDLVVQLVQNNGLRDSVDPDRLETILGAASPVHSSEVWAVVARFFSQKILAEGPIEKLETATTYLRRALVTMNDARHEPRMKEMLYRGAKDLGDLLMYKYTGSRPVNVAYAAELYRLAAERWSGTDSNQAVPVAVMASLAATLAEPDSEAPLDSTLPQWARRGFRDFKTIEVAVEELLAYGDRLAYVARTMDQSLFKDARTAADFAQLLVERGVEEGVQTLDEESPHAVLGLSVKAFDMQLGMEKLYHGYEGIDVTAPARASGEPSAYKPLLVYLRPLATSRRIELANEFGARWGMLVSPGWPMPEALALEGALHTALKSAFTTQALGGPIDMFGMARSTILAAREEGPLEAWHDAASMYIATARALVVLLEDSGGLLWELGEIARQDAREKVVVVIVPNRPQHRERDLDGASLARIRSLGFAVPEESPDGGFLLLDATGSVERSLEFASLWNGQLLDAMTAKAHRAARASYKEDTP